MSDHDIANKELEIFRSDATWYQLYGFAEQVYTDLVFYEDDLGPHPDKELRAYQPIGAGFGSAQSDFQEACSARRYP